MPDHVEGAEEDGSAALLLRGGDVGDRGDVVPVDPVPEAEPERRDDEPETEASVGDRA